MFYRNKAKLVIKTVLRKFNLNIPKTELSILAYIKFSQIIFCFTHLLPRNQASISFLAMK